MRPSHTAQTRVSRRLALPALKTSWRAWQMDHWTWAAFLPSWSCVTLASHLSLSGPQFPHYWLNRKNQSEHRACAVASTVLIHFSDGKYVPRALGAVRGLLGRPPWEPTQPSPCHQERRGGQTDTCHPCSSGGTVAEGCPGCSRDKRDRLASWGAAGRGVFLFSASTKCPTLSGLKHGWFVYDPGDSSIILSWSWRLTALHQVVLPRWQPHGGQGWPPSQGSLTHWSVLKPLLAGPPWGRSPEHHVASPCTSWSPGGWLDPTSRHPRRQEAEAALPFIPRLSSNVGVPNVSTVGQSLRWAQIQGEQTVPLGGRGVNITL